MADERAEQVAAFLGRSLKNARLERALSQAVAAEAAGLSQSCWSDLERGRGARVSLRVWERAGDAVNSDLRAYLERASAADAPRDAVHLRHQELIARVAQAGGWTVDAERSVSGGGVADLVLTRSTEACLIEVWTWFADVGDAFRSWDRKLDRVASATGTRASGCWVVRATRRNRELLAAHRTLFRARFPGNPAAWASALADPGREMPRQPAILWVSVKGDRLLAATTRR